MKMLLTPIDFSPISEQVVATAGELARAIDGCVVLLHVVAVRPEPADFVLAFDRHAALVEEARKAADARLAAYRARLEEKSVTCQVIRATGFPHVVIPEQAKELAADFVVMGSHGHTALYDLIVGNTTSAVIKTVGCPVIIVPARRAAPVAAPPQAAEVSTAPGACCR